MEKLSDRKRKRAFKIKLTHLSIVIWLSIAAFIQNIVMGGAMNVIISSLQKEFYLSSQDTGIYISGYDMGSLISSLIIPILGSYGSKPRWIGFGMLMLCIGCFVNVLPHFIRPKTYNHLLNNSLNTVDDIELCFYKNSTGYDFNKCRSSINSTSNDQPSDFRLNKLKYILFASNIINGMSSASLTTLAFSYIEDVSPHRLSAIYESFYYASGALGMGIGFMITSQFLNIHNDIDSSIHIPEWLTPNHPNWIGAWWIPFIIFGGFAFLLAVLFNFFPEKASNTDEIKIESTNTTDESDHLNNNTDRKDKIKHDQKNYETEIMKNSVKAIGSTASINHSIGKPVKSISEFKHVLTLSISLLKNPVFVFILIASAIEGLIQNSFLAFAPLFLEYQYRIASGTASLILGALSIPPLILGSLLSGYLIKRFDWKQRSNLKFLVVALFVNTILFTGFYIHCKEPNLLFNKIDYQSELSNVSDLKTNSKCLTVADSECNCDKNLFRPVCLINRADEYVFQTACIAGCKSYDFNSNIYSNCSYAECMLADSKVSNTESEFSLSNGLCPTPGSCKKKLIISYITIFFVMFFTAMVYVPYMKVTIGCTSSPDTNPLALGIKQLAMTGIGSVPGPIVFGSFIDLTCKYWYTDCLNQKVCKVYTNQNFAFTFGTLGVGFKFICWLSVFIGFLCLKFKKNRKNERNEENS
jgi:organic anion transporter 4A